MDDDLKAVEISQEFTNHVLEQADKYTNSDERLAYILGCMRAFVFFNKPKPVATYGPDISADLEYFLQG